MNVERGTAKVKCLAQENNTITQPGLKPNHQPQSSAERCACPHTSSLKPFLHDFHFNLQHSHLEQYVFSGLYNFLHVKVPKKIHYNNIATSKKDLIFTQQFTYGFPVGFYSS